MDVHIRRLRLALEPFGAQDLIETVRGAGYRIAVAAMTSRVLARLVAPRRSRWPRCWRGGCWTRRPRSRCCALGAAGLVAFHLWNQHLVRRWASGSLDAPVPEGTGSGARCSPRSTADRMRAAYQRDLRLMIDRFRARPRRSPTASSCSTRPTRSNGRTRAPGAARARCRLAIAASRSSTWCGSRSSVATSTRATTASRSPWSSDPGGRRRALSLQLVPFGVERARCCCRTTSRRSRRWRGCAATSSPTCRTSSRRRSP